VREVKVLDVFFSLSGISYLLNKQMHPYIKICQWLSGVDFSAVTVVLKVAEDEKCL
jgi:hypothetical protein